MRQSAADGQNDSHCGANASASARSSGAKCQSPQVRHQATPSGSSTINRGARALGAALYQVTRLRVTEPSRHCQRLPGRAMRRGMIDSDTGRAPTSCPTTRWASSWQMVPARVSRKNRGMQARQDKNQEGQRRRGQQVEGDVAMGAQQGGSEGGATAWHGLTR